MPVIPFAIQCTVQENQLLALKDSVKSGLKSACVSKIPGFEYYLSIYPNGDDDSSRGEVWMGFYLELGYVKQVEADYTILIESANYSHNTKYTYERSVGWIKRIADKDDFFKRENGFIVDGKLTVKINGILKFEIGDAPTFNVKQQKWEGGELGNELWKENDNKDLAIAVDGKEIKVHKLLLLTRSEVFKAMLNPKTKESIEYRVEIPDFTFDVVETGVKMIYQCDFVSSLSLEEMMSLLQFFDKYNISSLKEKVEPFLINQVAAATVCRLANCSVLSNSIHLKTKCMAFLIKSFASKTILSDIKILDKDILVEVVENSFYEVVEIQ